MRKLLLLWVSRTNGIASPISKSMHNYSVLFTWCHICWDRRNCRDSGLFIIRYSMDVLFSCRDVQFTIFVEQQLDLLVNKQKLMYLCFEFRNTIFTIILNSKRFDFSSIKNVLMLVLVIVGIACFLPLFFISRQIYRQKNWGYNFIVFLFLPEDFSIIIYLFFQYKKCENEI